MTVDHPAILADALLMADDGRWDGPELDELRRGCPMGLEGALMSGERYVLATAADGATPDETAAAMHALSTRTDLPCVCALSPGAEAMSRPLHDAGVAYVTATGEAFVPGLLRITVPRRAPRQRGKMSPAARTAFLWLCMRPWTDSTATMLSGETGLPRSTAQRAMCELREILPMKVRVAGKTGRALVCRVADPWAFAEAGAASIGCVPVARKLVAAGDAAGLPLAGASALAARSRLAAPEVEVRACSRRRAHGLARAGEGVGASEVLVLPYDPEPLSDGGIVDPATMALTCDGGDPMVAAALAEALEDLSWLLKLV